MPNKHGLVISPPPPVAGAASVTALPAAWTSRPTTPLPSSHPAAAVPVSTGVITVSAVSLPVLDEGPDGGPAAGRGWCEDVLVVLGLVAVQLAGAAYMVVLTPILAVGLEPLFLITFGSLANSLFTLPFAVKFESSNWRSELNSWLILQFVLLALGGVTGFQALMLHGMKKTSPAIASALPNLAPGFIFIISACLRFEKVDLKCPYTRAKIMGTIVCLGGAITISLLQSPSDGPAGHVPQRSPERVAADSYKDWVIGCMCILVAVLVVSGCTVLQAATMIHFPATFTLCTVTSLIGAVLTGLLQVITEGKLSTGTPLVSCETILCLVLVGGLVSSVCVVFQTWALKKKGPVMVSMFSPTQTVGSAIFSALFLGRVVKPGSMVGIVFLFSGLYVVLWAKKKEGRVHPADSLMVTDQTSSDVEKPLLS